MKRNLKTGVSKLLSVVLGIALSLSLFAGYAPSAAWADPIDGESTEEVEEPKEDPIPLELVFSTSSTLSEATVAAAYKTGGGGNVKIEAKANLDDAKVFYNLADKSGYPAKSTGSGGSTLWSGGGLPKGLVLNQDTGAITGTPEVDDALAYPNDASFTVEATAVADGSTEEVTKIFTIKVNPKPEEPKPPVLVKVLDLVGMNISDVKYLPMMDKSDAKRYLKVLFVYEISQTVAKDLVISQSIKAGTEVELGSAITVTVSLGKSTEKPPPALVKLDLYAYTVTYTGGFGLYKGRSETSSGGWEVPGGIVARAGQIRLCATAYYDDGKSYSQNQSGWPDGIDVLWSTSDNKVAAVSSQGIVAASNNGRVTITARATDGDKKVSSSIEVTIHGQEPFPYEVQIVSKDGTDYGDERITFKELAAEGKSEISAQLYARVVLDDGTTVSNAPDAKDYQPKSKYLADIKWWSGDTQNGYVNTDTGKFIPRGFASLKVYAEVTGGDPSFQNGVVKGYVWIVIDSGNYPTGDNWPTDKLTIKVTYELDRQHIAKELTFTIAELQAIQSVNSSYTFTKDNGEYVTSSASGIYITTLIKKMGVSVDDIYRFTFAANDGVNPGEISPDFLFRQRYYWPYYEFGGNTSGAKMVFPMLAWAADWRDSAVGATNSEEDYSALNPGIALRLLFGSEGKKDGTSRQSLKFTNTMTILLKGAPPIDTTNPGDGTGSDGKGPGSGDSGDGTGGGGDGSGTGAGGGVDGSGGDGYGSAGTSEGRQIGSGKGSQQTNTANGNARQTRASATDASGHKSSAQGGGASGKEGVSGGSWHVYQVLSNSETQIDYADIPPNPLRPYVPAVAFAMLFLSALWSVWRWRSQTKPLSVANNARLAAT